MSNRSHSDDLYRFSYSVFKVEYIIVKLVFFGLSLFGLLKLIEAETGMSVGSYPGFEISKPAAVQTARPVPSGKAGIGESPQ